MKQSNDLQKSIRPLHLLSGMVFLAAAIFNVFVWSTQPNCTASFSTIDLCITHTPFNERLWAALGHEAWYIEHGYLNVPPPARDIALSFTPTPTRIWLLTSNTYQLYLPAAFQSMLQRLTPTVTPISESTKTPTPMATSLATATFTPTVLPPSMEARAIWVTRFDWTCILPDCPGGQVPGPDTIRQMVANIDAAGFNMILFQIRGQGDAYYTPGLEPWSARLTGTYTATLGQNPGWDPLATLITAAHARGMQVHAYFNVYPIWSGQSAPPDGTVPLHFFWVWSRASGSSWNYWRQWDTAHQVMVLNPLYLWASPGNDWLVEDYTVATALDLLKRYELDGLHLDSVRYAGPSYSCDPRSEERWGGPCFADDSYADWQRMQITRLVRRIYQEGIVPLGRRALLSAAVWWFPQDLWGLGCSGGYDNYYQDSHGWLSAGVMDAEMPMLYGCSAFAGGPVGDANWVTVMRDWLSHGAGRYVFPGIIADMDFASIETRINAERAEAATVGAMPGHAIFSYGIVNSRGYWNAFASGPYQQRAMAPTSRWHP